MKLHLLALGLALAAPGFLPAQTVEGPGDDVACSGYPRPQLQSPNARGRGQVDVTNRAFPQPPPIHAVTEKPYSARRITQELQIRADGTQICQTPTVTVYYRDSEGRTRQESAFGLAGPDGKPAPISVRIVDPIAQTVYELDMRFRIAYRLHPMTADQIPQGPPGRPAPPDPTIHYKTESLGTHSFQGVTVEGRLNTTIGIPPGSSVPLQITQEVWTWPYLNSAVLTRTVSPGSRRTDASLQLSTAEPDPALFRVPDGWQVIDGVVRVSSGGYAPQDHTTAGYQYTAQLRPPSRLDYLPVRDAPYYAEQTYERSTNLALPGVTRSEPSTRLYRDPYGRTRIERPLPNVMGDKQPPPVLPEITDPIEGVRITLDPVHHVAHRFRLQESGGTNPPPYKAAVTTPPHSIVSTKDLGNKTIEGVDVEGTLDTYRTPVGANGNDRELTETSETWYSPALKLIVLAKQNMATYSFTTALTHLRTDEPDQSLFEIPTGYTVVDETSAVTVTITQP